MKKMIIQYNQNSKITKKIKATKKKNLKAKVRESTVKNVIKNLTRKRHSKLI